jgi:hypothetical protein
MTANIFIDTEKAKEYENAEITPCGGLIPWILDVVTDRGGQPMTPATTSPSSKRPTMPGFRALSHFLVRAQLLTRIYASPAERELPQSILVSLLSVFERLNCFVHRSQFFKGNKMGEDKKSEDSNLRRIEMIQVVQTPLGFFVLVVLIVESILGILVGFGEVGEKTVLIKWMFILIFVLVGIVAALAFFRPEALSGIRYQSSNIKYSLLVGQPENMPSFDITLIDWNEDECFVVCTNLREKIALIPSRVGPSFRVHIPGNVLDKIKTDEAISLELKDRKGNRWKVKPFYLFENLLPLSVVGEQNKIIQDYGEKDQ